MSAPSFDPNAVPTPPAPGIGTLVPLGHAVIKLDVSAQTTMPDTPNGYTAAMRVMADQGDLDRSALAGPAGPAGQISFQPRQAINPFISTVADLPILPNSPAYIGTYYEIQEFDELGDVVGQFAYIWYGTSYRKVMVGAFGPPGPVPRITPEVALIPPEEPAYVATGGPRLDPVWEFFLPAPYGPTSLPVPLATFPDVDFTTDPPVAGDLFGFSHQDTQGNRIFANMGLGNVLPQAWSMPQSAFSSYSGVSQQAAIGSLVLPAQPFAWTPIVWGHVGGQYAASLSADPLMIGCQVLLGNATVGIQVARGLGNTLGEVNVMPHYSSAASKTQAITPINSYAVVPANHTNPADGTLYINLWNDGQLGVYNFSPTNAQLFVMVMPALQEPAPQGETPARRRRR